MIVGQNFEFSAIVNFYRPSPGHPCLFTGFNRMKGQPFQFIYCLALLFHQNDDSGPVGLYSCQIGLGLGLGLGYESEQSKSLEMHFKMQLKLHSFFTRGCCAVLAFLKMGTVEQYGKMSDRLYFNFSKQVLKNALAYMDKN